MYQMLDTTVPLCRPTGPRYLMGVGRPQDLLEAVDRGIDLFDCVHAHAQRPQRHGLHRRRQGTAAKLCPADDRGRWRTTAPARPADIAGDTCGTLFWPQMLGRFCLRSTT